MFSVHVTLDTGDEIVKGKYKEFDEAVKRAWRLCYTGLEYVDDDGMWMLYPAHRIVLLEIKQTNVENS